MLSKNIERSRTHQPLPDLHAVPWPGRGDNIDQPHLPSTWPSVPVGIGGRKLFRDSLI
jgi:hypothetical protein